jgi:LysR family transcriptional regulator, glycine cleavage system transcriptional activator
MRRLPPFPELVAFEAVARHLSFTRAAAELSVTQSAVSHRVRRLEKYFGMQLIRRLNPGIVLTDAGAALLPELAATLNVLERLGGHRERRLRVAAGSALCTWWLAGRLSGFMTQRPGVSVELVPIENDAATIPEVDVRILWVGAGDDAVSATQAPLFNEHIFPVCSPQLLPNKMPLRDHHVLGGMTLLHKATHATGEWSWPVWLERLGVSTRRGSELRFADMGLTLSAAVDGAGVALSRSLLVHDALQSGRLMVAIAGLEPMVSTKKHVARWRKDKVGDPDINAFVAWLVAEAAKTMAATDELSRALGVTRTPLV